MTTFEVATLIRRPSASRPDLMAMLSSCAPSVQLRMITWSLHSGSQPSVLECAVLASVVTPSTVTFLHSVGCICQNCGFFRCTAWISTVSQLYGSTNVDRMLCPEPGTTRLCGSVTPFRTLRANAGTAEAGKNDARAAWICTQSQGALRGGHKG